MKRRPAAAPAVPAPPPAEPAAPAEADEDEAMQEIFGTEMY